MSLVGLGRKTGRFVQNAKEVRVQLQKGVEPTKAELFAFQYGAAGATALAYVGQHLFAQAGQQLVQYVLPRLKVVVEGALRHTGALRDQGNRGVFVDRKSTRLNSSH